MIKVRIKKLPTARTGYQVQGALVNDVPAMGGADYNAYIGQPKLRESKYITAVPREEANLEAEGGETVYGDINGDGFPEHQIIKGPRHHSGGVPLNLPDDTFIFSDTRTMKIKDPEILDMFGKVGTNKAYTPAQLAKQYDIQKYRKILEDPESDHLDRKTAELMIKKYVIKLGCLALAQEAKKGFPQGIPVVAKPCMDAKGITAEQVIPPKELLALKDQISAQYEEQENSAETMGDENQEQQFDQAQELNQGQPVAQPQEQQMEQPMSPEGMMMYGGHRRLRRAQEGMEQPSPEEMAMMQQQQGGGDEMMQIVQEVEAALQKGVDPQQIVASLLGNQVPPEAIVQIFTQIGASQEQAIGLVQEVMQQSQDGVQEQMMAQQPQMSEEEMMQQQMMQQQGPPMAMYGMSMGGYDLPFYDQYEEEIPEAEYGMAMGSGMSQNYEGRPKPIPGSGPMFSLPKAANGIIIKRSDYKTDDEYNRAIWNAEQERKKSGSTDPITVIGADGKQQIFKGYKRTAATDVGTLDMSKWGTTDLAKQSAARYYLLQQSVQDPNSTVRKKLCEETTTVLGDEKHFRGKTNPGVASQNWTDRGFTMPDCDKIIESYLKHQERNLMFDAKAIDGALYADTGRGFAQWDDYTSRSGRIIKGVKTQIAEGAQVRDPRDPTGNTLIKTKAEMEAAQKYLKDTYGGNNVSDIAANMGVPFETGTSDRALQQATFHGYTKMLEKSRTGAYNADEQYALRNFLGDLQTGVADEASMANAFPGLAGQKFMISPIDDFTTPEKSFYGNTTMKHLSGAGIEEMVFEDVPADPNCQCTDPSKPNYGQYKDAAGNCSCTPPDEPAKECPCTLSDGTVTQLTPNADGSCPPCEEEKDIDVEGPPAEWWLQDTIKTTGAFGDLMGIKKYMPWAPGVELQKPRPAFLDPTRELAANAEQANIQTQAMGQFAGPQSMSARSASIQGQAAKNAADVLSKYNNANINIANQFELKGTDIANQESMLKQATAQRIYDQNTVANQQFDNSKLAMRNNLRNYYTNAITNRWQTDALNQMYPNYQVSPGVGGRMYFNPTEKTPNPSAGTGVSGWQKAYEECKKNNPGASEAVLRDCAKASAGSYTSSSGGTGANAQVGMGMYAGQKKRGGDVDHDNGYVYLDTWLPFLM